MATKMVSTEISVATSGTQITAGNAALEYLCIQNKGVNNVHLSFGSQGGVGDGLLLGSGEKWEPHEPPVGAVFGRSSITSNDVVLIEGTPE